MKSVKIVSDGSVMGTKLHDAETGEEIHGVSEITWSAQAQGEGRGVYAVVTFVNPEIEAIAQLRVAEQQFQQMAVAIPKEDLLGLLQKEGATPDQLDEASKRIDQLRKDAGMSDYIHGPTSPPALHGIEGGEDG